MRVWLVGGNPSLRRDFARALSRSGAALELAACFCLLSEALAACDAGQRFELLLVELGHEHAPGEQLIAELSRRNPEAAVLTFTADTAPEALLGSLHAAHAAVFRAREPGDTAPGPALTARERQVLALLCQGISYAQVALSLSIRQGTVQTYVKNIYKKLGVTSKVAALRVALDMGLLPSSAPGP